MALTPEKIEALNKATGLDKVSNKPYNQTRAAEVRALAEAARNKPPEKSTYEKVGEKIGETSSNLVKGALKGAGSTIATVPTSVGKVVGAVSDLGTQKDYADATETLADTNLKVIEQMRKLPEDSPRRAIYQKILDDNTRNMESINEESKSATEQAESFGKKPDFLEPKGTAEKVGYGAEKVAEFVYGGKKLNPKAMTADQIVKAGGGKAANVAQKIANIGIQSAGEGVSAGLVTAAQGGDLDAVKKNALTTAAISAPFKAYAEFAPTVAGALQKSAEKKATQALAPTTKQNKILADKVVPEMLRRKVTYLTRGGLEAKAGANADDVGAQIGDAFEKLPADSKTTLAPIIQDLEKAKSKLFIAGTTKVPSAAVTKFKALQDMQKEIIDLADEHTQEYLSTINNHIEFSRKMLSESKSLGQNIPLDDFFTTQKKNIIDQLKYQGLENADEVMASVSPAQYSSVDDFAKAVNEATNKITAVPSKQLRSLRQILDTVTKESGQGFGFTGNEKASLMANKEGANAIRNALAKDYPAIDKLNKEYSFWKNVEDLVGATVTRTKGQGTPLGEQIAEGTGAVVGAAAKGTFGTALLTATGLRLLKQVVTSPGWRNTSAIVRQTLADHIISGNSSQAIQMLNRLLTGSVSAIRSNNTDEK